jgi:dihydroorotase-like cyclic amidohydrolase
MYDIGDIAAPLTGKPSPNHFFYNGESYPGQILECSDVKNVPPVRMQGDREGGNERFFTGLT